MKIMIHFALAALLTLGVASPAAAGLFSQSEAHDVADVNTVSLDDAETGILGPDDRDTSDGPWRLIANIVSSDSKKGDPSIDSFEVSSQSVCEILARSTLANSVHNKSESTVLCINIETGAYSIVKAD
jgi:hypothetical protein